MPNCDTVEQALASSIKKTRQLALSTEYKQALAFYTGLDEELTQHIASLEDQGDSARADEWRQLRDVVAAERQSVHEIVAELGAFSNPAAAVRLDRNGNGGGGAPASGGGANPYRVPRPAAGGGGGGGAVRAPYRTDDDDDGREPPFDLAAHDEPPRPRHRDERPVGRPAQRAPPVTTGEVNSRLYGDRDRFAPPEPPGGQPMMGFGAPPAIPKRTPSNNNASTPQARGSGGAQRGGGDRQRKPALPKFGAGGGAAAPSAAAKRGGGGDKDKDGGKKGRAPYVPRPGEEEFAEAIFSEMTDPATIGVQFDDIAGQSEAKEALQEAVIYPALMPDYYSGILRPAKGVLLYGPPGTGKSMLAKAVASMGKTTFFNVSTATLVSKMRGDSEKLIRILFEMARHYSPSVIFIDEIDSLCGQRGSDQHEASRRTLSVLLTMMDGVGVDSSQYVMVLGATNHPWDIDEAMRRRLEKRVYIPLPGHDETVTLLKILTSKQDNVIVDPSVDYVAFSKEIARMQYSGADLATLAREAFQMPMRRYVAENRAEFLKDPAAAQEAIKKIPVTIADFRAAVQKTPSSIEEDMLKRFEEWKGRFE